MAKTISFVKGKGSLSHNNRDFVAENVDQDRMDWNVYYIQQSLREAYDQLFGAAVTEYNSKQKRKVGKGISLDFEEYNTLKAYLEDGDFTSLDE